MQRYLSSNSFILFPGVLSANLKIDGNPVPEFSAYDQMERNIILNRRLRTLDLYVSTSWCTHCETTLDAYENVIPEGSLYASTKTPENNIPI